MDREVQSTSSAMTNARNSRPQDVSQKRQKEKERLEFLMKTKIEYDDLSETIRKKYLQKRNFKDQMDGLLSKIPLADTTQKSFHLRKQFYDLKAKKDILETEVKDAELDLECLMGMDDLRHRQHKTRRIQKKIQANREKNESSGCTLGESNSLMYELWELDEEEQRSLKAEKDIILLVNSSNHRENWIGEIDTELKILQNTLRNDK